MKHIKKIDDDQEHNMEHTLLMESADREEKLANQLTTLEIELAKTKHDLKQMYAENEKLALAHQDLNQQSEQLKDLVSKHKSEIKSLKERENRLLVDNTELDGENVQLQEQIAKLKEELVELDTIRHENKGLEEKLEALESQIVELTTLKRIVEKQLEESLNSIREEREYKYQEKRAVNKRREKESLQVLERIGRVLDSDYDDGDLEDVTGQGLQVAASHQQLVAVPPSGGIKGSFAEEVETVNELEVLKKQLEDLNKHKEHLENELNEFKDDLNLSLNGVNYINKRLANYAKHQNDSVHVVNESESSSSGEAKTGMSTVIVIFSFFS